LLIDAQDLARPQGKFLLSRHHRYPNERIPMRPLSFFIAAALAVPAFAQPVTVAPWMTGAHLLELATWPPGAKDNFDLAPRQVLDRQSAQLYLHGVHDATEGRAWCYDRQTRPKPDVIEDAALASLRALPAARLQQNAADLLVVAWAARWPCQRGAR
jgi:hypothetical protein